MTSPCRRERARHVIVRALVQSLDLVVHIVPCRQHDDRRLLFRGAQRPHHLEAVLSGQHDIEDDDVVVPVQRVVETVDPVVCNVCLIFLLPHDLRKRFRKSHFIFNDQNFHIPSPNNYS